jgi:hypothetical protein
VTPEEKNQQYQQWLAGVQERQRLAEHEETALDLNDGPEPEPDDSQVAQTASPVAASILDDSKILDSLFEPLPAPVAPPMPTVEPNNQAGRDITPIDTYALFPADLKLEARWLVYQLVWNPDKRKNDKIPHNPLTGSKANDPKLGVTFDVALSKSAGFSGLGIYVEPPYFVIDIDGCRDPKTGIVQNWVMEIIRTLDTYAEASPSETGVHIWGKGTKPGQACRKGIEIYTTGRFMTVTGLQIPGTPSSVNQRDISRVYSQMVAGEFAKTNEAPTAPAKTSANPSAQIKQTGTAITTKLELLMNGKVTLGHPTLIQDEMGNSIEYPSHSEADEALCTQLVMTGMGSDQIDEEFRKSGLCREKWEREDYRERTIRRASQFVEKMKAEPAQKQTALAAPIPIDIVEKRMPDTLAVEAYHGVTGRHLRNIEANSEAHPAGILVLFLAGFGSIVGTRAYMRVEDTIHYAIVDVILTGRSSRARKDTTLGRAVRPLKAADPVWASQHVKQGFSSGEAVASYFSRFYKLNKPLRLFVTDTEFKTTLTICGREGNTLSETYRHMFNGDPMEVNVKNLKEVISVPYSCGTLVGLITWAELLEVLKDSEMASGFVNRRLTILVHRVRKISRAKKMTDPDQIKERDAIVAQLKKVLEWIESRKNDVDPVEGTAGLKLVWSEEAGQVWDTFYNGLGDDDPEYLTRAEVFVMRLGMIYALLDKSDTIQLAHLEAALAVWSYAEQSSRQVYGNPTPSNVAKVMSRALAAGYLKRGAVNNLFGRHMNAEWLDWVMEEAARLSQGRLEADHRQTAKSETIVTGIRLLGAPKPSKVEMPQPVKPEPDKMEPIVQVEPGKPGGPAIAEKPMTSTERNRRSRARRRRAEPMAA